MNFAAPPGIREAISAEVSELSALSEGISKRAPDLRDRLDRDFADLVTATKHADHPIVAEKAAETFAHELRHAWLSAAASATSEAYRSPTVDEAPVTASGRHEDFGYERELQPDRLEARCRTFFGAPAEGWQADHILFSSGQAAMTAALLLSHSLLSPAEIKSLRVSHIGSYFETRQLLELFPSVFTVLPTEQFAAADIAIIEPVSCGGSFSCVDVTGLIGKLHRNAEKPKIFILDSTLVGRSDGMNEFLELLQNLNPVAVLRVNSGLKLFQAGLELANVGILSAFVPGPALQPDVSHALRRARTLMGTGLRFSDVAALEAPWFLDPVYTSAYEAAIFSHNAELAAGVEGGAFFESVSHPSLFSSPKSAPYCAFRLRDGQSYDALTRNIVQQAAERRLLLEQGGSFGFRGHRFEVVRPDDGAPPFLRVALGRRGGWSCTGVMELIAEIARDGLDPR